MYFWKRAFVFSCYLKDLDGTGILGVVKFPKADVSNGSFGGDNVSALLTTLSQQRIKDGMRPVSHALPVGEKEYLPADSRLWSVPYLGFLAINKTLTGVECDGGEKKNALVATRKLGNKTTNFYLFESDVSGVYSGSLGHMQFRLSKTADSDVWHMQIISY